MTPSDPVRTAAMALLECIDEPIHAGMTLAEDYAWCAQENERIDRAWAALRSALALPVEQPRVAEPAIRPIDAQQRRFNRLVAALIDSALNSDASGRPDLALGVLAMDLKELCESLEPASPSLPDQPKELTP